MRAATRPVLTATIFIGIVSCSRLAPTPADLASDRAAIEAVGKAHATAYSSHDLDTIMAGYADDAVVMPPDGPAVKGLDAIRKLFAASMASAKAGQSESFEDHTVEVSGDMGWDSGISKVRDPSGSIVWSGHFLATWRKKDGKWQTVRDMWTNDPPSATK